MCTLCGAKTTSIHKVVRTEQPEWNVDRRTTFQLYIYIYIDFYGDVDSFCNFVMV